MALLQASFLSIFLNIIHPSMMERLLSVATEIVSATCYLPLSDNMQISKELGTRHRAAVGISEVTDTMTLVVSEETGNVSIAIAGELIRAVDQDYLKRNLLLSRKNQ